MLVAYLDEFGHVGPYISPQHPKFNDHPVFGYAGFILPAENVRAFGAFFQYIKSSLLKFEIELENAHPGRWEKKGASLLTTQNYELYAGEIVPALRRLFRRLEGLGGKVVFYGQVKPTGSAKETGETSSERISHTMRQTLVRVSGVAGDFGTQVLVFLDSVDAKPRLEAVQSMASFMYAKGAPSDVSRIADIPIQLESKLYANIQFADWICSLLGRTTDGHLVKDSQFKWAASIFQDVCGDLCTTNSKISMGQASPEFISAQTLAGSPPARQNRTRTRRRSSAQAS